MTADDVIRALGLAPLPGEGGWFRETWRAPGAHPDDRPAGTAIYYLLAPDMFSALHRLPHDEIFHFYRGDPVEMLQLRPDGSSAVVTIGNDLAAGLRPQVVVPSGVWQGTRLVPGGRFALMGTTMAPGFDLRDFELGTRAALLAGWPGAADLIRRLTRE
jgi:predicted cupin superfamily sugar epimerase